MRALSSVLLPVLLFAPVGNAQTTCGTCIPPELDESAKKFEKSIANEDHPILRRRQLLGALCVEYECGDSPVLREDQVSKLVDLHIEEEDKRLQEEEKRLANEAAEAKRQADQLVAWVGAIGAVIAGIAALLTFVYAAWQAQSSSRRIGQVEKREEALEAMFKSVRNGEPK